MTTTKNSLLFSNIFFIFKLEELAWLQISDFSSLKLESEAKEILNVLDIRKLYLFVYYW